MKKKLVALGRMFFERNAVLFHFLYNFSLLCFLCNLRVCSLFTLIESGRLTATKSNQRKLNRREFAIRYNSGSESLESNIIQLVSLSMNEVGNVVRVGGSLFHYQFIDV